jgi:hypothetical protein
MKSLELIKYTKAREEDLKYYLKENFFQELFDKYENLQFLPFYAYRSYVSDLQSFLGICTEYENKLHKIFKDEEDLYFTYIKSIGFYFDDFDLDDLLDDLFNERIDGALLNSHSKNYRLRQEETIEIDKIISSIIEYLPFILNYSGSVLISRNGDKVEKIKLYNNKGNQQ